MSTWLRHSYTLKRVPGVCQWALPQSYTAEACVCIHAHIHTPANTHTFTPALNHRSAEGHTLTRTCTESDTCTLTRTHEYPLLHVPTPIHPHHADMQMRTRERHHDRLHTLNRVHGTSNFSLNLTTVAGLPGWARDGYTDAVAPRRPLPRCQPMAMDLFPAGQGCRVCTVRVYLKRVLFDLLFRNEFPKPKKPIVRRFCYRRGTELRAACAGR